jgi:hypothetical protein
LTIKTVGKITLFNRSNGVDGTKKCLDARTVIIEKMTADELNNSL